MVSKQENDAKKQQKKNDVDALGEALESCIITKPANVEDIDKEDHSNPQLCAEYVQEIYNYMHKLEVNLKFACGVHWGGFSFHSFFIIIEMYNVKLFVFLCYL